MTCGEDGQIRLWAQEGSVQSEESTMMDVGKTTDKKVKRKDKKKSEKDRFNPY